LTFEEKERKKVKKKKATENKKRYKNIFETKKKKKSSGADQYITQLARISSSLFTPYLSVFGLLFLRT
jgi:NADH:ubiquinone oxidoreductase subunit 6 (subunit J)